MSIVWRDDLFRLGVEDIDTDHRKKIDALNQVAQLIEEHAGSDSVAKALSALIDSTAQHFAHEESLMRRTKYPAVSKHAELHQEFLGRLKKLQAASFSNAEQLDARAELDFFSDWMAVHIQNADRNYVHWLHPEI